jgi:hypothetical protein
MASVISLSGTPANGEHRSRIVSSRKSIVGVTIVCFLFGGGMGELVAAAVCVAVGVLISVVGRGLAGGLGDGTPQPNSSSTTSRIDLWMYMLSGSFFIALGFCSNML